MEVFHISGTAHHWIHRKALLWIAFNLELGIFKKYLSYVGAMCSCSKPCVCGAICIPSPDRLTLPTPRPPTEPFDLTNTARAVHKQEAFDRIVRAFVDSHRALSDGGRLRRAFGPCGRPLFDAPE